VFLFLCRGLFEIKSSFCPISRFPSRPFYRRPESPRLILFFPRRLLPRDCSPVCFSRSVLSALPLTCPGVTFPFFRPPGKGSPANDGAIPVFFWLSPPSQSFPCRLARSASILPLDPLTRRSTLFPRAPPQQSIPLFFLDRGTLFAVNLTVVIFNLGLEIRCFVFLPPLRLKPIPT